MLQFSGILKSIFRGASTSATSRWTAADFIDRVLFATPSVAPVYWAGGDTARPIPGLPDGNGYDGVEVFDGHVLLWRGDTLKWSDRNDFSNWVPISITAAYGRATLESDFTMPSVGSTTSHAYLSDFAGEFVAGQFVRMVTDGDKPTRSYYDYFKVVDVALETVQRATSISTAQTIPAGGKAKIYLNNYDAYVAWVNGSRLRVNGTATQLRVTACSRNSSGYEMLFGNVSDNDRGSSDIPTAYGGKITFSFQAPPAEFQTGDVVSVGGQDGPGQDLYLLQTVSYQTVATRLPVGSRSPVPLLPYYKGGHGGPGVTYVSFQHWVEVENTTTEAVPIPPSAAVSVVSSLVLNPLGFTGGTAVGDKVPAGAAVESVDANESGELVNVGAAINGDICACVTLAEFCYILKKGSIQSMQSVGIGNGVFFIRPEILTEGLVGRYAWCRSGDREIAFWGNKGIYLYSGGQNLRPIALQHYLSARDEMDRSRADEIVAHHNRRDSEIWFVYPTLAAETKVLVYNYLEGSVVVDKYDGSLGGITALGRVDWELAPPWESLDVSERYNGEGKRWYEYVELAERDYTVIGIGGDEPNVELGEDAATPVPRLLLHGRVWSRSSRDDCNPDAIHSVAETPDFDFGDSEAWKYIDTVHVVLFQQENIPTGAKLSVSIGARDNLNAPLRWTPARAIAITPAGPLPTNISAPISGRFIRLRFESEQVDANWAISAYHVIGRKGGTY